ncbi:MAG: GspE/PulE family protein [Puniceicoccales bacterium]|jgi:type II secretory ATPase GspE/PulE/Tfp pilus assembly ATPase PilB-like protein|nr:GspE/PulE family protein [Puniceicoccales bacterium]
MLSLANPCELSAYEGILTGRCGQSEKKRLKMTEIPPKTNDLHLCRFYHIIPDGSSRFLICEDCDLQSFSEELSALLGFCPKFEILPKKDFQKRWLQFETACAHQATDSAGDMSNNDLPHQIQHWLRYGVELGASDIHFESDANEILLRMRIDGTLRTVHNFPGELRRELSACLRAMANLDISEHFRPQDGRLKCLVQGKDVECRISVLPTKTGESIVLRILDKNRRFPRLDNLHMPPEIIEATRHIMQLTSGLFLVIGPTGSGKTTSIYAALQEINSDDVKLLTIEDPIEYELDGILQVPVDLAVGRTFSSVLRSFLRHDPDKILVGEIRDRDTAQTALQAALTGHLVLTTLHTATAEEALLRLQEMGADPFLLSRCLRGILSQRLLRLNCPNCLETYVKDEIDKFSEILLQISPNCLKFGSGCAQCGHTGYREQCAIFELFSMDDSTIGKVATGDFSQLKSAKSLADQAITWVADGVLCPAEFLEQIPC